VIEFAVFVLVALALFGFWLGVVALLALASRPAVRAEELVEQKFGQVKTQNYPRDGPLSTLVETARGFKP